MLSVHVMTNVPPLARSYQDGGCRIAERVGIRTIKKTNKQTKQHKTNKEQSNKQTKKKQNKTRQNKTRQNQQGATRMEAAELWRGRVLDKQTKQTNQQTQI